MQLTHWNPFREMEDFFSQLNRGYGRRLAAPGKDDAVSTAWAPVVDITESEAEYTVKAELPGIAKDDINIEMENGVLTLSGERKFEKTEGEGSKQHRIERYYGSFVRSFSVPDDIAADKISAEYKDGVLCVHLPKSQTAPAKVTKVPVS